MWMVFPRCVTLFTVTLCLINSVAAQTVPEFLVNLRPEFTDPLGNPISSIAVGSNFQARVFAQDVRPGAKGVFSAYTDATYQSNLASIFGNFVFGSAFDLGLPGDTNTPDLINEVGASRLSAEAPGPTEQLLFSVQFHADHAGTLSFTLSPATDPGNDTSIYGVDTVVPSEQIQYGTASMRIVPEPTGMALMGLGLLGIAVIGRRRVLRATV